MTSVRFLTLLALTFLPFGATVRKYEHLFCGDTPAPEIQHKIMGGETANPEYYPNAVALFKHDSYFCAGSLIAPGVIVTAAHCFFGKDGSNSYLNDVCGGDEECRNDFTNGLGDNCPKEVISVEEIKKTVTVRIGGYPLDSDIKKLPVLDIDPSYIRFFQRGCRQHDIAFLKVKDDGKAKYSCVLPQSYVSLYDLYGAMAVGWGSDAMLNLRTHNELQLLRDGMVLPRDKCIGLTAGKFPVDGMCIQEYQDKNTCTGDSGGPLLVNYKHDGSDQRLVTLGALSFGSSCDELRGNKAASAAVYTRLDFYSNLVNTLLGLPGYYDDLSFTAAEVNYKFDI